MSTTYIKYLPAGTSAPTVVSAAEPLPVVLAAAGTTNIGDVDVLSVAIPTTVYHGQTNVTTAGTEVTLAASQAILDGVWIKAKHANTGFIYVGINPVTSSTGYVLDNGESVFVRVANLNTIYIDSSVNGEGVSYIAT